MLLAFLVMLLFASRMALLFAGILVATMTFRSLWRFSVPRTHHPAGILSLGVFLLACGISLSEGTRVIYTILMPHVWIIDYPVPVTLLAISSILMATGLAFVFYFLKGLLGIFVKSETVTNWIIGVVTAMALGFYICSTFIPGPPIIHNPTHQVKPH